MAIGTPRRWCVVLDDGIVQFYVSFMAGRCDAAHPRRADPTVLFRRPPSPRTLQTLSRSRRYEKVSGGAALGRERHRVSRAGRTVSLRQKSAHSEYACWRDKGALAGDWLTWPWPAQQPCRRRRDSRGSRGLGICNNHVSFETYSGPLSLSLESL
jgi:hypothetical protein